MIYQCILIARSTHHSSVFLVERLLLRSQFFPTRTFFNKWKSPKPEQELNREKSENELKPLTGIDDPNFTDHFLRGLFEPDFRKSYNNIYTEFGKFYNETKTDFLNKTNFRIDSRKGRIDMLFTFEKEEDQKNFIVTSDSSSFQGYSSASFKITPEKTAVFYGNISTEVPKDGNVNVSGFANFANVLQRKSFNRIKFFNWTDYSHLVFKIRGDGRTYVVIISVYGDTDETQYTAYAHPLYTRGGPYWQIAKIPLSHFYVILSGKIMKKQNVEKWLHQIKRLGVTISGYEGPFKLEIDYIGLEYDKCHKAICPYELYHKIKG